jgi:uncharacterized membrane protein
MSPQCWHLHDPFRCIAGQLRRIRERQPSGPWHDPNLYGIFMALGLVASIGCLITAAIYSLRNWSMPEARRSSYLAGVAAIFLLVIIAAAAWGLLNSYSRGAWLAALLGVCRT